MGIYITNFVYCINYDLHIMPLTTPLDVLPLEDAKSFLRVDYPEDDSLIESLIYSAVNLVEQKTQYRLYQRTEKQYSDGTYTVDLFQTPLNDVTVTTFDGTPFTLCQIKRQPVRTQVIFKGFGLGGHFGVIGDGNEGIWGDGLDNFGGALYPSSLPLFTINIDCGYTDVADIPVSLLQAVKTLVSYMYENRDWTPADIPSNVFLELVTFNQDPLF